jgi:hypothetical protein
MRGASPPMRSRSRGQAYAERLENLETIGTLCVKVRWRPWFGVERVLKNIFKGSRRAYIPFIRDPMAPKLELARRKVIFLTRPRLMLIDKQLADYPPKQPEPLGPAFRPRVLWVRPPISKNWQTDLSCEPAGGHGSRASGSLLVQIECGLLIGRADRRGYGLVDLFVRERTTAGNLKPGDHSAVRHMETTPGAFPVIQR